MINADDLVTLATAILVIGNTLISRGNSKKIDKVHDVVNGNNQRQVDRNDQLTDALNAANIPIPQRVTEVTSKSEPPDAKP